MAAGPKNMAAGTKEMAAGPETSVPELIHATCITLDGRGVLIRGPSGSGKSDLALRCLALGPSGLIKSGAVLVADDQVLISAERGQVMARAPSRLRGLIEVRGQGIISVDCADAAEVTLVVDLIAPADALERLPDPIPRVQIAGQAFPLLRLHGCEASAPVKVLVALALRYGHREG